MQLFRAVSLRLGALAAALSLFMVPVRSAEATMEQLTCTPGELVFSKVIVGQSKSLSVTMTNTGATSVMVSRMRVNPSVFSVGDLTLPLTLAAGQSVQFNVTFTPTTTGRNNGNVVFTSNASNSELYLPLGGLGVNGWSLTATPSQLVFGNVQLGRRQSLPVSLTNAGSSSVTLSQGGLTGAGFHVNGIMLPLTLSAGQNLTFDVVFAPESTGTAAGRLSLSSPSSPILQIVLGGTGASSVYLSWAASTSPHVVGYNIYRHDSSGSYTKINSSLDVDTNYVDASIVSSGTYYYATTAVNSSGQESSPSNVVKVVIP
jgi:hypothetical protein